MKEMKERRFEIFPNSKGELISAIINTQIRLIELENKLGNVNVVTDEDYISKLRERLENLNETSLRKYYSMLKKIVIKKEEEYSNKLKNEQDELLQQLVNDYLGENIIIPNDVVITPIVHPDILPIVQPVIQPIVHPGFHPVQHPQFPWDEPYIQIKR
jgi:hypothetical protein